MKPRKQIVSKTKNSSEPDFKDSETWSGEQFHRAKQSAYEYYRLNHNNTDYKKWVLEYIATDESWKNTIDIFKKIPDSRFHSTIGSICRLRMRGCPDEHLEWNKHWESLPGTTGTPKPASYYINKFLTELEQKLNAPDEDEQDDNNKEDKKVEKYVPTIQERIAQATAVMSEFIEQAVDDFLEDKITDFKSVSVLKRLREVGCKQPHARNIKLFYEPHKRELEELMNPPKTDNMSELEKDLAQQLKEGYSHFNSKQIKALYSFYIAIDSACDGIIAESKANRKPRKMSKKAPEQVVKKLKYKITDEKYGISSIESHKIVSANMLVVFNCKNRKLGVYYTSIEDPTGTARDGSGLNVKGTTLERYNEEKSIWKTLRKPVEQLQEVKSLNTRRKFENWFESVKTTPVKMNGRINPETILIGVY